MQDILYKYRPHICLGFAAYAVYAGSFSPAIMLFTGILVICAWYIFILRSGRSKASIKNSRRVHTSVRNQNRPKVYTVD